MSQSHVQTFFIAIRMSSSLYNINGGLQFDLSCFLMLSDAFLCFLMLLMLSYCMLSVCIEVIHFAKQEFAGLFQVVKFVCATESGKTIVSQRYADFHIKDKIHFFFSKRYHDIYRQNMKSYWQCSMCSGWSVTVYWWWFRYLVFFILSIILHNSSDGPLYFD